MAGIKLADGRNVREIRVFRNGRWYKNKGNIFLNGKWVEFSRPGIQFQQGRLDFETLIKYDVWQINDNLTTLNNPKTWGLSTITKHDGYYEVKANEGATSWGLITDRDIGLDFIQNQDYTISFEIKSDNLNMLRYNYIISDSGNTRIDSININKPSEWTKFSLTFKSTDKDRINAGILLGGDLRNEPDGTRYFIRNVKIEIGKRVT